MPTFDRLGNRLHQDSLWGALHQLKCLLRHSCEDFVRDQDRGARVGHPVGQGVTRRAARNCDVWCAHSLCCFDPHDCINVVGQIQRKSLACQAKLLCQHARCDDRLVEQLAQSRALACATTRVRNEGCRFALGSLQQVAIDLVERSIRLATVEPADKGRVAVVEASEPWRPIVVELHGCGSDRMPPGPARTIRAAEPRLQVSVQPVQRAAGDGVPEVGGRHVDQLLDATVGLVVAHLWRWQESKGQAGSFEGLLEVNEQFCTGLLGGMVCVGTRQGG